MFSVGFENRTYVDKKSCLKMVFPNLILTKMRLNWCADVFCVLCKPIKTY